MILNNDQKLLVQELLESQAWQCVLRVVAQTMHEQDDRVRFYARTGEVRAMYFQGRADALADIITRVNKEAGANT